MEPLAVTKLHFFCDGGNPLTKRATNCNETISSKTKKQKKNTLRTRILFMPKPVTPSDFFVVIFHGYRRLTATWKRKGRKEKKNRLINRASHTSGAFLSSISPRKTVEDVYPQDESKLWTVFCVCSRVGGEGGLSEQKDDLCRSKTGKV